jgi:hypothetical protein
MGAARKFLADEKIVEIERRASRLDVSAAHFR